MLATESKPSTVPMMGGITPVKLQIKSAKTLRMNTEMYAKIEAHTINSLLRHSCFPRTEKANVDKEKASIQQFNLIISIPQNELQ